MITASQKEKGIKEISEAKLISSIYQYISLSLILSSGFYLRFYYGIKSKGIPIPFVRRSFYIFLLPSFYSFDSLYLLLLSLTQFLPFSYSLIYLIILIPILFCHFILFLLIHIFVIFMLISFFFNISYSSLFTILLS